MDSLELKITRIRAGLKQKEVALRAGIAATHLSEYENGRRRPSAEMLERIIRAINDNSRASEEESPNA